MFNVCYFFFLRLSCCCCTCFLFIFCSRCRLYFSASRFSLSFIDAIEYDQATEEGTTTTTATATASTTTIVDAVRRVSVVFEINSHLHTYITPNTAATNNDFSCNFSSRWIAVENVREKKKKRKIGVVTNSKILFRSLRVFFFSFFFIFIFKFNFIQGRYVNKK